MLKYILKRIGIMIPTVLLILFIIYAILDFLPTSPARIMLGMEASQEEVDTLNEELGYYDPLAVRYVRYVRDALHGDFGRSYQSNQPVFDQLLPKFPTTLKLAVLAILVTTVIGIPLGVAAAVCHNSAGDRLATVLTLLLASVPSFFLGMLFILLFALKLQWLPSNGLGTWKNYVLPVFTLALPGAASLARLTRSTMLDVMNQDYIRTARAKGCSPLRVITRHGLRNAMMPVVTQLGMNFAGLLGGALICEKVFGLPGFGNTILSAIYVKDIPIILGATSFLAILFMLVMLAVDVIYAFLDPRVGAKYKK